MTSIEEDTYKALEEAFDKDLEDTEKRLGNGKGKATKKDQNQKYDYMTFKYSSRFRGTLHEAILLNGAPVFIKYQDGQIQAVPNIEEQDRILRPPSIEEYPYEPIEFSTYEELKKFQQIVLEGVNKEILFQKIFETVSLYIDQDEEIRILISADIFWTYFQDLFPTTHYYDISGTGNGIGKSTIGHVFEGIAYRAVRMTDPSAPSLYRILGKIEPGQCIIIADEADRIHTDKDMMSILKEGYTILGKVSKINKNTEKQEFFFSYCFKMRIAEDPMRPSFAKGVIDRSFMIRAIKGCPRYDIKEVLHPASRRNGKLEKLHESLRNLRKLLLIFRLVHFDDPIFDLDVGLNGRDKELCKPLLQFFHDTRSYNRIDKAIKSFLAKKNIRRNNTSIEPVLYDIIKNMIITHGTTISVADIWEEIMKNVVGLYNPDKPNEFQSHDYDTIYRSTITKILEGLGAERKHKKSGNVLIFDKEKLDKIGMMYEDVLNYDKEKVKGEGSESSESISYNSQNNDIKSIVKYDRQSQIMPSPLSPLHPSHVEYPPKCYYCIIGGFSDKDHYEEHVVRCHKGLTGYPGPTDLEKHNLEPQGMYWENPRNAGINFEQEGS
ncbi:MAG: hypothetical protein GEU26_11045 [Nitrososphaeraceae archaeon]|nr:hypothetical protein [Nitrososphaeraceae archaeon]